MTRHRCPRRCPRCAAERADRLAALTTFNVADLKRLGKRPGDYLTVAFRYGANRASHGIRTIFCSLRIPTP